MKNLLSIADLSCTDIEILLQKAIALRAQTELFSLSGKSLLNYFAEPSTRTRVSFELAAKRLDMQVINVTEQASSIMKGESLADTLLTFAAMGFDFCVLRQREAGIAKQIAKLDLKNMSVINAGDGAGEHPTQALLDLLTIKQEKKSFQQLSVAIVGDSRYSRVAHSLLVALMKMAVVDIRLIGPAELLPTEVPAGVNCVSNLAIGLQEADVVIVLRMQKERISAEHQLNPKDYYREYGVTNVHLAQAKPDVMLLHPGPVNRGIELDHDLPESAHSFIQTQVGNGVFMRMAILQWVKGGLTV